MFRLHPPLRNVDLPAAEAARQGSVYDLILYHIILHHTISYYIISYHIIRRGTGGDEPCTLDLNINKQEKQFRHIGSNHKHWI